MRSSLKLLSNPRKGLEWEFRTELHKNILYYIFVLRTERKVAQSQALSCVLIQQEKL